MSKVIDLTGRIFGRLRVIDRVGSKNNRAYWKCLCDCGNTKLISSKELINGDTKSCGCLQAENRRETGLKNKRHGCTKTRLYCIWSSMKKRCLNPKDLAYHNYGGRGITVCDEWKNNYRAFREWAITNGYKDSLTIDRTDNNKNYEPNNCRWATHTEQQRNKRNNVLLTYNGQTLCLSEWAEIKGLYTCTLWRRINRNFSIERALNKVVRVRQTKN